MRIGSICRNGSEVSARISGLPMGPAETTLWFRFPEALSEGLAAGAEPFVAAMLPLAMQTGEPLRVEGAPLSPRFVSGCAQVMQIWSGWDDRLRPVSIDAESRPHELTLARRAGCFFTGGVDSWYTLLKNLQCERGHDPITDLVYVKGYSDLPLADEAACRRVETVLRSAADGQGCKVWVAETNLHQITKGDAPVDWDPHAGVKLTAVGLALRHVFRRLHIPAGETYASSMRTGWGSHPNTDPLWSSESLSFQHDGCEASRSEKLDWYVARSALALEHLWVCSYPTGEFLNCGRCEKCLRTLAGLRSFGVGTPAGFAEPLDLGRVSRLDSTDTVIGYYLRDNLKAALGAGDLELAAALEQALQTSLGRSVRSWCRRGFRKADQRVLNGRIRLWVLDRAGHDAKQNAMLRSNPLRWVFSQLKDRG